MAVKNSKKQQQKVEATVIKLFVLLVVVMAIVVAAMLLGEGGSKATTVQPDNAASQGDIPLPDYRQSTPFSTVDKNDHEGLSRLVASAKTSANYCKVRNVPLPSDGSWEYSITTNICDLDALERIVLQLARLAPALRPDRLTVWKTSLQDGGKDQLIVGYVDMAGKKKAPYPYLSLWALNFSEGLYRPIYRGTFLAGGLHAVRSFGSMHNEKAVFVKYLSCIECEPSVLLTAIDFMRGRSFDFTYASEHNQFDNRLEYELPGKGDSSQAKVETRIPSSRKVDEPHLLQHFRMSHGNRDGWWIFTCKEYRCDYELYKELPKQYSVLWDKAENL